MSAGDDEPIEPRQGSPEQDPDGGRAYGGLGTRERRAARRARMMDAATELFGQREGWTLATVEKVCGQAGVATRSVYEEFGGREGLLLAVYAEVVTGATAAIDAALVDAGCIDLPTRVRRAITAYVTYVTTDPRRARIAHVSMRRAGDWAHAARAASLRKFTGRIHETLSGLSGHARSEEWNALAAAAVSGGVNELIAYWAQEDQPPDPAVLIELIVGFISALLAAPTETAS